MAEQSGGTVTALLLSWRDGDKTALDRLVPLVYAELRRVARARLKGERDHSLQPTALVHEAYLQLVDLERMTIHSRAHFCALAARLMRQILVDHARRRRATKRGGGVTIFFRLFEQSTNTLVRIKQDGSGRHKVGTVSIVNKYAVSPDGEWVIVHSASANEGAATLAVPVDGGPSRRICIQNCPAAWSSDGRFLYVARGASATAPARTLALPVPAGKTFPDLPAPGIDLAASHVSVPGGIVIDLDSVSPGPDPATYVFTKSELGRNLFRIPLR